MVDRRWVLVQLHGGSERREVRVALFQIGDLHSFSSGRLAFGNFVFVKRDCIPQCESLDGGDKIAANELLSPLTHEFRRAADESLQLVERLHRECGALRARLEALSRHDRG